MNVTQDSLTSKVELSIACRNLKDMDVFSKSDPMAVLFQKLNNSYMEIGRTEIVKNNLNPVFSKVFEIDYHFEERQLFKIEIYDSDSPSMSLTAHDFLGRYAFSLGELVSRRKTEATLTDCTSRGNKPHIVILTCQEMANCKESIILQFQGAKLDKKDLFGKSDPLFELYRANDSIAYSGGDSMAKNYNNFSLVFRSKPIMNTLNPSWPAISKTISHLCCGDKDRLIKFVCGDWNSDGSQDFIGECFTSVNHLLSIQGKGHVLELRNPKKQMKKKNYQNSGTIALTKAIIQVDHTFIDYISGGTELNFTVAIDFTASNGNQSDPRSLHFISHDAFFGGANQYESAIYSVGSIIQDYDYDKMFPALGFGARIPPRNDVSHCFPINFCIENPFCQGVDGLLNTYRSTIRSVKLSGPTNFSPSIRHVQQFAHNHRDGSKYFVLLIITDGIITDIDATVDAIIDCSFLPMSIIIIGVGNEDFSAMDMLDCDNGKLRHGHKVSNRDIVQFVAIRDYMSGRDRTINQAALSKAVLFELPKQVTGWMRNNGIAPLPPNKKPIPFGMAGDSSQLPTCPTEGGVSQLPPHQMGGGAPQYPPHQIGGSAPQYPPHQMGGSAPQFPPQQMGGNVSQFPPHQMGGGAPQYPPHQIGGGAPQFPPRQMGGGAPQYPPQQMGGGVSQFPPQQMRGGAPQYPPHQMGGGVPQISPHHMGGGVSQSPYPPPTNK